MVKYSLEGNLEEITNLSARLNSLSRAINFITDPQETTLRVIFNQEREIVISPTSGRLNRIVSTSTESPEVSGINFNEIQGSSIKFSYEKQRYTINYTR